MIEDRGKKRRAKVSVIESTPRRGVIRFGKILKQVEYESDRRKRHINEKTRRRDEEGSTFFYVHLFFFFYFVENGSKKLNFR